MANAAELSFLPLELLWSSAYGTMNVKEICDRMGEMLFYLEWLREMKYCVEYVDELVFNYLIWKPKFS